MATIAENIGVILEDGIQAWVGTRFGSVDKPLAQIRLDKGEQVEIIGKVTLSRCHPSLLGARWLIGVPLDRDGFVDRTQGRGEPFVIYDEIWGGDDPLGALNRLLAAIS